MSTKPGQVQSVASGIIVLLPAIGLHALEVRISCTNAPLTGSEVALQVHDLMTELACRGSFRTWGGPDLGISLYHAEAEAFGYILNRLYPPIIKVSSVGKALCVTQLGREGGLN